MSDWPLSKKVKKMSEPVKIRTGGDMQKGGIYMASYTVHVVTKSWT